MAPRPQANKKQSKVPTPKHTFLGHGDIIWSFVFLHDDIHIVSASWDGTIRKWNCETGLLVGEPWEGEGGAITALTLSPDGETVACGRESGSVQRWGVDGSMMEDIWMNHSSAVLSLSWSPSGDHIASGSEDGIILITSTENGKVKMCPIIKMKQGVYSLAYSPSGDRIASGWSNAMIHIWDGETATRFMTVDPFEDLGDSVTSIVWSSDGSKLYTASDRIGRVFDSVSGALLRRFYHDTPLWSVALSPKHNILAFVDVEGVGQLWDTLSYQPLDRPFHQVRETRYCHSVSFSRDGKYLAHGGIDKKITLWMVKDIVSDLAKRTTIIPGTAQQTRTCHDYPDGDATKPFAQSGVDEIIVEERDDPYTNFFQSSQSTLALAPSGPSFKFRLWSAFFFPAVLHQPANESMQPQERLKRPFFARHNASLQKTFENQLKTRKFKTEEQERRKVDTDEPDCPENIVLSPIKSNSIEYKQDPLAKMETFHFHDPSPTTNRGTNKCRALWKLLVHPREEGTPCKKTLARIRRDPSQEAVEVYTTRGFQRFVAYKRKRKTRSPAVAISATYASDSLQEVRNPQSSHLRARTSSHAVSVQDAAGAPTCCIDDDSCSKSSIQGSLNKILSKICFPC